MEFLLALCNYGARHDMTFCILTDNDNKLIDITVYYKDTKANTLLNTNVALSTDVCQECKNWMAIFVATTKQIEKQLNLNFDEDDD